MSLERQGVDAFLAEAEVAAAEPAQVLDPRRLEPDEVGGVVGDALRVRLRKADGHVVRELEVGHALSIAAVSACRLAELIATRQPCVVLTGAGISTESGIPDFRSPTGIWAQVDPMEYASLRAFEADPEKVWEFYAPRIEMLTSAEPNEAHRALAELERRKLISGVVTQNIDLLHERAGSSEVVEVHGSIRSATCPRCRAVHALEEVVQAATVPRVQRVPQAGRRLLRRAASPRPRSTAPTSSARGAALMLVVGSALEVYPVADLPLETLRSGGTLAIVNLGSTALDGQAELRIDGSAGATLSAVLAALDEGS